MESGKPDSNMGSALLWLFLFYILVYRKQTTWHLCFPFLSKLARHTMLLVIDLYSHSKKAVNPCALQHCEERFERGSQKTVEKTTIYLLPIWGFSRWLPFPW